MKMNTDVDNTADVPKSLTRSPSSNLSLLKKYAFSFFLGPTESLLDGQQIKKTEWRRISGVGLLAFFN